MTAGSHGAAQLAMIVYQLVCEDGHSFEAWFRDSATFERQQVTGDIECPMCASRCVGKAPMAPNVARGRPRDPEARAREVARKILSAMEGVRRHVEDTCDDVGQDFPEEARRIHYGEAEKRGIYGEADDDEAADLLDEGIDIRRIPWPTRRDS